MKTKEIILDVEEYVVVSEEDLFTGKDLADLLLGTVALFIFVASLYVIFYLVG